MTSPKLTVSKVAIELQFNTKEEYQSGYLKLIENFESCSIVKSYRAVVDKEKFKISFLTRGGQNFLYETCEEVLYHLFSSLKMLDKKNLQSGLNDGLRTLDSSKFLFMVASQRKFLLAVDDKSISLIPILNQSFRDDDELLVYYKELIGVIMKSLEGFARSRLHLDGRKIFIEYHDAIDQFIYVMREVISSPKLFTQDFVVKDFLISLIRFIVKHRVNRELKNLNVECNYDHPLNCHRYLTLMTHKLFSKLSYNGAIESINHEEIERLAEAISYEKGFEKMPAVIANAYNNLVKVLPFKTVEKISRRSKNLEYFL